ncbi:MAG: DUF5916 domain-containing protein [Gemmatimonadaceae bacterium]
MTCITNFAVHERNGSGSIISSGRITAYSTTAWNFGGDLFYDEVGVTSSADLRSFWSVSARGSVLPAVLDDRLARGGPLAKIPARWRASGSVSTDFRRRLVGRIGASLEAKPEGGSDRAFTPSLTIRASPALQLSIAPTLDFLHDEAQYVRTDSSRSLFATLRQQTLTVSGRMDWTLTPALSVQVFVQPFVSTGRYGDERELLVPRTFPVRTLSGGDVSSQSTFLSRALRANAVLRWEYRSGSDFYLVWQQTRDGYSTAEESSLERGFDRVLQVSGRNVLYLKVSYRLGR